MQYEPNPTIWHDAESADRVKCLGCVRYDACLSIAAAPRPEYKQGWPSFHCGDCDAYESKTRDDMRSDHDGLMALLYTVLHGGSRRSPTRHSHAAED